MIDLVPDRFGCAFHVFGMYGAPRSIVDRSDPAESMPPFFRDDSSPGDPGQGGDRDLSAFGWVYGWEFGDLWPG